MKILHLSSEKTWRGGEQQIAYLIEELIKLGVDNHVACRKGSAFEKYCITHAIDYTALSFSNSLDLFTALAIKNYSHTHDIDLIHIHSGKSHGIATLSAFLGNETPLILSRRVDFPVKNGFFSKWKYNHPKIRKIICVSDKIREIIEPSLDHPEKAITIYSGVDLQRFSPDKKKGVLRNRYEVSAGTYIIGNTSALAPHKDYFTFIDTAEEVRKLLPNSHFFIIGDGPLKKELIAYSEQKQMAKHITFTGFLTNIPEILPELDVFLITSETEGLGTTVLDAFLSEVPVVGTNAGGIPEMVKDHQTGILKPVKDSKGLASGVAALLTNNSLRNSVILNAKKLVTEFSKESTAKATFEVYKEVLSE